MTKTKETIARAAEVRRLLSLGVAPKDIAKRLGMTLNNVYGIRAYDRMRLRKEFLLGIPTPTPEPTLTPKKKLGRPKGSKNKRPPVKKAEALIVLPKGQFLQLQQEIETLTARVSTVVEENTALRREIQTLPKTIEMPVPQPFSHYSFWQRLGILFLGRAA